MSYVFYFCFKVVWLPFLPYFVTQIIEDSEERLKTDQEIEELLNVIATKLPDIYEETVSEEKQEEDEMSS